VSGVDRLAAGQQKQSMSRSRKILLGALTAWPVVYFFVFLAFFVNAWNSQGEEPAGFTAILIAHLITMLVIMGLLVFYIVHVYRSARVPDDKRVLWAVILFLGNMIAMPVYFFLYIWRASDGESGGRPAQGSSRS
jgi:magnesium-transporting ATPase (P-type)